MRLFSSVCVGAIVASALACNSEKPAAQNQAAQPAEPTEKPASEQPEKPASGPEQIVLSGVVVKTVDPKEGAVDVMPRELARHVGALLTSKPEFVRAPEELADGHRGREAKLEVVITYNVDVRPKEAAILCAVEAKLVWASGDDLAPRESIIAERPLSKKDLRNTNGLVLEHVAATVAVAAQGIAEKEALRDATSEQLVSALTGKDLDKAIWALELVGDRKLSEALDSVIATLASDAPEVRDTAIGTLVALGDPRAVKALADLAEFSDHDLMRMVLEAVSSLGGTDAMEYLEFIASGHPDADIKGRAAEGLERLRKNPRGTP